MTEQEINNEQMSEQIYTKPERECTLSLLIDKWGLTDIEKKKVIGKDGKYFKITTEKNSLEYIWYDIEENSIKFWGDNEKCINAQNTIITRINKFKYDNKEPTIQININIPDKKLPIFVGKNGYFLKETSTKFDCKLWHEKSTNIFKLWGFPEDVEKAKAYLLERKNQI